MSASSQERRRGPTGLHIAEPSGVRHLDSLDSDRHTSLTQVTPTQVVSLRFPSTYLVAVSSGREVQTT